MKSLICIGLLLLLAVIVWLGRWQVTPMAWDRSEGSRAVVLDRWTGNLWLIQKQGVRQTHRLTE
jgi:hypothetical protein